MVKKLRCSERRPRETESEAFTRPPAQASESPGGNIFREGGEICVLRTIWNIDIWQSKIHLGTK